MINHTSLTEISEACHTLFIMINRGGQHQSVNDVFEYLRDIAVQFWLSKEMKLSFPTNLSSRDT